MTSSEHHPTDPGAVVLLDPIDGSRFERRWRASAAHDELLEHVLGLGWDEGPAEAPPLRRPRRAALAAAAAVLAALVAVVAPWSTSPAYAVRVLPDGVIEIDWTSGLRSGEDLAAELRSLGIDVEVVTVAASPSAVGSMTATSSGADGGPPPGVTWGADGSEDVFTWRIDPSRYREQVRVELAVAAEDGAPFELAQEVFEPGEVLAGLHCAEGVPLAADAVAGRLEGLGLSAVWDVVVSVDPDGGFAEERVAEVPDGEVLWGYALDAGTVRFTVLPEGLDGGGRLERRLSDVPCSPEQAARW
jgi:hypothetical protein